MTHNLDIDISSKSFDWIDTKALVGRFSWKKNWVQTFYKPCGNKGVYKEKAIGKENTAQRHGNGGEIHLWCYSWNGGEQYVQSK